MISFKKSDGNNILHLSNVYIYRTTSSEVCHLIVKKTLRGNFFFFLFFFKQIKKQELRGKVISQSPARVEMGLEQTIHPSWSFSHCNIGNYVICLFPLAFAGQTSIIDPGILFH